MKNSQIKVGGVYFATVTNKKVQVQIDEPIDGGGWKATNLSTGKKVTIKSADRLEGAVPKTKIKGAVEPEPKAPAKPAPKPKTKKPDGKLSCIAAAFKVLEESGEPMNTKQMIEAMETKGYWQSPGGKTPHATLYSAILRDIAKGDESRFEKVERGRFQPRG